MEIVVGLFILFALVGGKWAASHFRISRFHTAWADGIAHLERKDFPQAESAFRNCLRHHPISVEARYALAASLTQQQRWDEAEEHLSLAANLQPKKADGPLALGYFYLQRGPEFHGNAAKYFQRAIELDPNAKAKLSSDPRLDALRQDPSLEDITDVL